MSFCRIRVPRTKALPVTGVSSAGRRLRRIGGRERGKVISPPHFLLVVQRTRCIVGLSLNGVLYAVARRLLLP